MTMTTNTITRTALVEAIEEALHLNEALIAATTDAQFDAEIAADAIISGDINWHDISLVSLAAVAIMNDGPWWVRGTLDDAEGAR